MNVKNSCRFIGRCGDFGNSLDRPIQDVDDVLELDQGILNVSSQKLMQIAKNSFS
jgi:hypothetical protein